MLVSLSLLVLHVLFLAYANFSKDYSKFVEKHAHYFLGVMIVAAVAMVVAGLVVFFGTLSAYCCCQAEEDNVDTPKLSECGKGMLMAGHWGKVLVALGILYIVVGIFVLKVADPGLIIVAGLIVVATTVAGLILVATAGLGCCCASQKEAEGDEQGPGQDWDLEQGPEQGLGQGLFPAGAEQPRYGNNAQL